MVRPPIEKVLEVTVEVPVEDMTALPEPEPGSLTPAAAQLGRSSIWPAVEERIYRLITAHRSTIVFANSRRLAERLCGNLNQLAADDAEHQAGTHDAELDAGQRVDGSHAAPMLARAHHGSVSKEQRHEIEAELKAGRLPAVVATSSLELGIDMGAVDLVIQVEAPPSVASGLQRIGRAGHHVGVVSRGTIFPQHRSDLVSCAVVARRMSQGQIESIRYPRNPLDVLAQQVVAMVAMDEWPVDELAVLVRRAAPFAGLPESSLFAVLDMLAGRYPSDEFAELRPRLNWDRESNVVSGRAGAGRLAVTSGGTIPDRGLFGVFLAGTGASTDAEAGIENRSTRRPVRVGELDEEMVYESRVGDVFTLGSSNWRVEEITHDRVLVSPAPGSPGRPPFWKGDSLGRPLELGRALGAFLREISTTPPGEPRDELVRQLRAAGLDERAASNLLSYVDEQKEAIGYVPDDRTIVVEQFRDELGDWRVAIHSVFGTSVNAPWAMLLGTRLRDRLKVDVQVMHTDDGMILRLPDTTGADPLRNEGVTTPADDVEAMVTAEVGQSALFAARFRECAARALLLPRHNPGQRTPLWQQRQRSAQLLGVAAEYGSFPIVMEAMRECLHDVFDVPGLAGLMRDVEVGWVRVVETTVSVPSPFARSLLFSYVGRVFV